VKVFAAYLFLLLALPAFAAISPVQSNATWASTGASCVVAFSSAPVAGHLIVVWTSWTTSGSNGVGASVSDSETNTFLNAVGPTIQPSSNTASEIFYAGNIAGGGADTVTLAYTSAPSSSNCVIGEVSGADPIFPLDSVSGGYSYTASTLMDSGNVTPANSNLLLFAAGTSSAGTASVGAGYTLVQKNGSSVTEYAIVSGNNVLQRATAGLNLSGNWVMQIAGFRDASVSSLALTGNSPPGGGRLPTQGNINGLLWIGNGTSWTGDIGAQFNQAEASLPPTGGEIDIVQPSTGNPPSYMFSTPIVFNKTVKLKCVHGSWQNTSTSSAQTTVLTWTGGTVPPIQIGTPIQLTSASWNGTTGTVTCAINCVVYPNQKINILNTIPGPYYYNGGSGPTFFVGNVTSPTTFTLASCTGTCPTPPSETGGFLALPAAAEGSSVEGCQLSSYSPPTSGPPAFIDVDNANDSVVLDSVIVDTNWCSSAPPPNTCYPASIAAFQFGASGLAVTQVPPIQPGLGGYPVVDAQCRNTFVRSAAPVGYKVISVKAKFTGFSCRSLDSGAWEWQIGEAAGGAVVENFSCYGCSAEAKLNSGTNGVTIYQAEGFHWYGGYFEHGGAGSYALEIPLGALVASNVQVDGSFISQLGNPPVAPFGCYAYVQGNPPPPPPPYTPICQLTITNNRIGGPYASPGYIVDNPYSQRTMVMGNDANVGTLGMSVSSHPSIQCGNTINGALVSCGGLTNFAVTAGGTTAYTAAIPLQQQGAGTLIYVEWNATNTGASTLNVNGLGAMSVTKNGTIAVAANDLLINEITALMSDGTNWQIVGAAYVP
jgi:hypothetical protein